MANGRLVRRNFHNFIFTKFSMEDTLESKSAKKNKKRRKKAGAAFEVEEDVSMPVKSSAPPEEPPADPIDDLKRQIEEAKSAKDHEKAQELRHKVWVLQDTIVLGKAGPGAPKVDLEDIICTKQEPARSSPQPVLATGTDPTEKKLNKLRKKLQQVEALKERRDNGEKLETNQVKKIEGEQELMEEISILESLLTGAKIV